MRTKEEAMKIADRLFKMNVIHEYSDCKCIYAFNYLLCRINLIIYKDICKAIREVLEDKKSIAYYEGEYDERYIKIYYGTEKDEKEKQELVKNLEELFDKEE